MKVKILFIYFISIFVFCANVYSAQIDLSSGQTWGATRGAGYTIKGCSLK